MLTTPTTPPSPLAGRDRQQDAAPPAPLPDLAVPEEVDSDTLERILLWAEFAAGTHSQFNYSLIDEVVATYGDQGLTLLGSALHRVRIQGDTPDFEPSTAWAKARAAELVAAGDRDGAVAAMKEHQSEMARYHGRILIRCDWCNRYRHGAEWHRRLEPMPDGWIVVDGATCPACSQAEADRDQGQDEAAELGRLREWMAAETSAEGGAA